MVGRRSLGTTGLVIAELGLGAMDTPESPDGLETLNVALDLGIDFVDTARDYAGSEHLIGQALRSREGTERVIASKTFSRTADGAQWEVDRSLSVLGLRSVELYQLHDVRTLDVWEQVMSERGALAGLKVARYRGLIGHIGLTTHDLEVARKAILSGEFETIMLEYSAFYPDSEAVIELARERSVGVIAMRPLGGSGRTSVMRGLLSDGYDGPLTPANLLRYVLSNPGVSVAIPGARYPSRVRANWATAESFEPLSGANKSALEAAAATLY